MSQQLIVWYMPVIHQGYLDYWHQLVQEYSATTLIAVGISPALAAQLQSIAPDPATLDTTAVTKLWTAVSGQSIQWLPADFFSEPNAVEHMFENSKTVHLVDDEVSRQFWHRCEELVAGSVLPSVQWHSVFLRWDTHSVQQTTAVTCPTTNEPSAIEWMNKAEKQSLKSSDWWRQVGSIAVKNNSEILRAYNQGMPDDHAPYQYGAVRDFVPTGTQPELANYIHAEQSIIAQAAMQGTVLEGSDLYVTHFPCPVCAKLIAKSGIRRVFFLTGSATLDGLQILQRYGIAVIRVIKE